MRTLLAIVIGVASMGVWAQSEPAPGPGILIKASNSTVHATMDKLEQVVTGKGFTVFARIDHAAGAARVGKQLPPNQVLIFGNPKVGTALLTSSPGVGLELPIRVSVWEDEHGSVWIAYNDPAWLVQRHGITDRPAVVEKMSRALEAFTTIAAQ